MAKQLPIFGYRNLLRDVGAVVSASSSEAGKPVALAYDGFTDTAWQGSGAGPWYVTLSLAGAEADYVGVFSHDWGDCTIQLQYSDDGETWSNHGSAIEPWQRALMWWFTAETHAAWRLEFTGTTAPEVSDISIGMKLEHAAGIPAGHSPLTLARANQIRNSTTRQGQFVGRSRQRRGLATRFEFRPVAESWVREHWDPFLDHAELRAFYVAGNPTARPDDVALCWTSGDIRAPEYHNELGDMRTSLDLQGIAK